MTDERIKEELSLHYLSTVAAVRGISVNLDPHDEDGTDCVVKRTVKLNDGFRFDSSLRVQLKCTSSHSVYSENDTEIIYQLKAKNYNDLCSKGTMPFVLGLLILPEDKDLWVKWSTDELMIKGRMYWKSLYGNTPTNNTSTVSVHINKTNLINPQSIYDMLVKVAKEENL